MPRMPKNWDKIAQKQFASLDEDIQADWSDLRDLTLKNR